MRYFILVIASVLSLALAAPSSNLAFRETAEEITDRLLFSTPISNFITARNAKNPPTLDWSSDGCSGSPNSPFGFSFLNSCYRHDFGYRNYKKQSRFNDLSKPRIDLNFKRDMYNQCTKQFLTIRWCEKFADLYFAATREFGKKWAIEVMERKEEAEREAAALEERGADR